MRRGNGVVLARALGCLWWDWEEHLSFFPRGSEFGWGEGRRAGGQGAVWPGGSCQGKSVCRSYALGVGRCAKQKRKKKTRKVKRCNSGPGLAQACAPSHPGQCRQCMGQEWPHLPAFGIQSPALLYVLARYFPKFQNPKTTRAGSCLACVCVCLCLRLSSFLACDRDRPCLCLPIPLTSTSSSVTSSQFSYFLRLDHPTDFLLPLLSSLVSCLAQPTSRPSWPLSVNLFFSSTKYSILSRDYQFTPVDCPTRQHSRERCPYAHANARPRTLPHTVKMFATKALRQAAAHAERVPSIRFIGKRSIPCRSPPSACKSSRPPRHPFSKSQADLVMLRNSRRRPHP